MKINVRKSFTVLFLAVSYLGARASGPEPVVQASFNNLDVRRALKTVFRAAKVSYTISSDVNGTVSICSNHETLSRLIHEVLMQVNATFTLEKGVYNVSPAPGAYLVSLESGKVLLSEALGSICKQVNVTFDLFPGTRDPFVHAHFNKTPFIEALRELSGQVSGTFFVDDGHLVVRPNLTLNSISLSVRRLTFQEILSFIFSQTDAPILAYPMPQGSTDVQVRGASLDVALNRVLSLVNGTGRMDGKVYLIYPRP